MALTEHQQLNSAESKGRADYPIQISQQPFHVHIALEHSKQELDFPVTPALITSFRLHDFQDGPHHP